MFILIFYQKFRLISSTFFSHSMMPVQLVIVTLTYFFYIISSPILFLRDLYQLFSYSSPPSPLTNFLLFSIHLYLQMDSLTHLTLEIIAHTLTTHQVSQVTLHCFFYFLFLLFFILTFRFSNCCKIFNEYKYIN